MLVIDCDKQIIYGMAKAKDIKKEGIILASLKDKKKKIKCEL